jgi:hypothetical protein
MFKKQIRHDESITNGVGDRVIPVLTFKSDVDTLKVQVVKKDGHYAFYSNFNGARVDEYQLMNWIPGEVIMGINL